jgi:exodeoxyribonuclease VII large subunit
MIEFPSSQDNRAYRDIYTISRLNREVKALLEAGFPSIWVEGEISNLAQPPSGHFYFSLKDAQAQVRCALFRTQVRRRSASPKNGQQVLIRARVSLYEGRGDYQLIVEHLEEAGEGALRLAFEVLKKRLTAEGLFDAAHKQSLPRFPKRIGVITSPSGAVLHDIVRTLRRRFPAIAVLLYPVAVQGEGAADEISRAIELAGIRRDCDAMILARGGGSLEDLWAFNEESVARALHACPIPTVCGVGHETDFTIADWVADVRAPTPTAAAELLSPDRHAWLTECRNRESRLIKQIHDRFRTLSQHLDWLNARIVHPHQRLHMLTWRIRSIDQRLFHIQSSRIQHSLSEFRTFALRLSQYSPLPRLRTMALHSQHLIERLHHIAANRLDATRRQINILKQSLQTLSPEATLARGYAIVQQSTTGNVLRDSTSVKSGERIRARLARGALDCVVEKRHDR